MVEIVQNVNRGPSEVTPKPYHTTTVTPSISYPYFALYLRSQARSSQWQKITGIREVHSPRQWQCTQLDWAL